MGICPTLSLVPKNLCDLVFKKIIVTQYFGYFVNQLDKIYLNGKNGDFNSCVFVLYFSLSTS